MENKATNFFTRNKGILIFLLVMLAVPFVTGLFEGSTLTQVWTNQGSFSKFLEGLGIEVFILAIFALSYDLLFGITGLLSFGHTMFFAVAASRWVSSMTSHSSCKSTRCTGWMWALRESARDRASNWLANCEVRRTA